MKAVKTRAEKFPERSAISVQAQGLTKVFDSTTAVKSVSFSVSRGEAFGLLGPNGAGKTTTMRMIYCRTIPTSGRLLVDGMDVNADAHRIKATVGVVPQETNLDPDLTLLENLQVYGRYFRIPRPQIRQRSQRLLEFFDLQDKRDSTIEALSGGMKRRLLIARALINNPTILVLDEPTIGLDPHARHLLWEQIRELRRRKITVLLSTHYMDEAEKLCDRLIIMDDGEILAQGSPRDLIETHVPGFVLEVHDAVGQGEATLQPVPGEGLLTETRGKTRFYYSSSAELLSSFMERHSGLDMLLRPTNLEDVFLHLTGRERLD